MSKLFLFTVIVVAFLVIRDTLLWQLIVALCAVYIIDIIISFIKLLSIKLFYLLNYIDTSFWSTKDTTDINI